MAGRTLFPSGSPVLNRYDNLCDRIRIWDTDRYEEKWMMKTKENAFAYLNKNRILNIGMLQVLQRGTAEILHACENGVYLRDTVSNAYMLSADDAAAGIEWMEAFEKRAYTLMQIGNAEAAEYAKQKYGFETKLICVQAVCEGKDASRILGMASDCTKTEDIEERKLVIREPDDAAMNLILRNYDKISEEEIWQIHRLHNLYAGYYHGECVGFIGSHLEGSMGLLEVLPEYRRRGFAAELERFMIGRMLQQGLFAFAQVEPWNEKSIGLQKKLGMRISEERVYWLY